MADTQPTALEYDQLARALLTAQQISANLNQEGVRGPAHRAELDVNFTSTHRICLQWRDRESLAGMIRAGWNVFYHAQVPEAPPDLILVDCQASAAFYTLNRDGEMPPAIEAALIWSDGFRTHLFTDGTLLHRGRIVRRPNITAVEDTLASRL